MKRFLPILLLLSLLVSCGPVKMYVDVESKRDTGTMLSVSGRRLAVISVADPSDRDSALVSELGVGVAEKIESEAGLAAGTVGVFNIPSTYQNIREAGSLDLLAIQSDADLIIALDSLEVSSFNILRNSNVYYVAQYEHVVDVIMPVSYNVIAYDAAAMETLYANRVVDTLSWTLMGEEPISNSTAISQANSHLKDAVRASGGNLAQLFLPDWEKESVMIATFAGSKWESAYYLALDFKWEQAIDIWLELVKGPGLQKQGCAAYNLAVACEILGRYDVALKWLDFAESKCYFSQMTTLRKKLQER